MAVLPGALLHFARPGGAKNIEPAKKMLNFAEAQLAEMSRTCDLGLRRDELGWCLSGRAVKKALGSAPTKKVELCSRPEAIASSRKVCAPPQQLQL